MLGVLGPGEVFRRTSFWERCSLMKIPKHCFHLFEMPGFKYVEEEVVSWAVHVSLAHIIWSCCFCLDVMVKSLSHACCEQTSGHVLWPVVMKNIYALFQPLLVSVGGFMRSSLHQNSITTSTAEKTHVRWKRMPDYNVPWWSFHS